MKTRIYFLDNLRTFLIFLVVVLHAGIVYEPILENTWIVSDPDKNSSIGLIRMYIDIFVMFILFFISGYLIPISLKKKTVWGFIKSKFNRLMVPWMIAVFTLIPAYKAIFLYSRGLPQEEWFSYFHLFQRAGGNWAFFADNPVQNWLWFLPVLFLFQLVYLALSKTNMLSIKISLKAGVIVTFVIGTVYSMIISGFDLLGWFHSPLLHFQRERLLIYFMAFLLGSLCYKLKAFDSSNKNKKLYLWANVLLTLSIGVFTAFALNLFFNMIEPGRNIFFVSALMDRVIYYVSLLLSMLSFLYIFIYAFRFSFNKRNRVMDEINKNSYFVYIIHMIVIGVVALLLLNCSMPAFVKFFVLACVSFIISNLLVFAYRKTLRKIFPMKVLTLAIPFAALLLTLAIYTAQANSIINALQTENPPIISTAPRVGLHMAVIEDNLEAVKQNIPAGSVLDKAEPSGGSSPLILSAVFGKTDIALALMAGGADVNCKNSMSV